MVVVGSSNSGHDIAQDYYEHGYDVTMVQRGSTHVVRSKTLVDVTMSGLYCEGGVRSTFLIYRMVAAEDIADLNYLSSLASG